MIYDKENDSKFETWANQNKDFLPAEVLEYFEKNKDILHLISSVHPKIKRRITPALRKLRYKQYPVLRTEMRPKVLERIEDLLYIACTEVFLTKVYGLVSNHKKGVNVRNIYPQLDEWAKIYARPKEPKLRDPNIPPSYWHFNANDWKAEAEIINASKLEFFEWKERRQSEFVNVVQNIYFKYYPELLDFTSDEWVVFAMLLGEEYYLFKEECEYVEEFIDYGFPEEYINLPFNDYLEKHRELSSEKQKERETKRDRRIAGEAI